MVEIVNVVGSGSLGMEIDLSQVALDLDEARYDPEKYASGLYLRLSSDDPLTTIYRTGKYIITGAKSESELFKVREQILEFLSEYGVIEQPQDGGFGVMNLVCVGSLEDSVDLNALSVGLGLENTEYEPEQFPAAIYRPNEWDCVLLIFSTGKVVITGVEIFEVAESAFNSLAERVQNLLKSNVHQ